MTHAVVLLSVCRTDTAMSLSDTESSNKLTHDSELNTVPQKSNQQCACDQSSLSSSNMGMEQNRLMYMNIYMPLCAFIA